MKFIRTQIIGKLLALLTGVLILNMSLFLAEADALHLLRDKKMTENIAKLLVNASNEEEKGVSNSAEEDILSLAEFALIPGMSYATPDIFFLSLQYNRFLKSGEVKSPIKETISPPPKG